MSMPLYENVYAISWNYDTPWMHNSELKYVGLYDGKTQEAIINGKYYFYFHSQPTKLNYYLTGHGLRQQDKDCAIPLDLSAHGSGTPIFGGYVDSHIGHFFIEVLARGIDFTEYKNHPVVFLLLRNNRADRKTFFKYCKFFGLDERRIVILDAPAFIPKMHVPAPQFFITQERIKRTGPSQYAYINAAQLSSDHVSAECFSERFLEVHRTKGDQLASEENTIDKILYLSCVKAKNYFGEYIVHKVLEDEGHTVIYPENHSWESVISLVRQHRHIVGIPGSALHFLLFCRKKKKVTYYDSMPILRHNFYNLEQMLQNDGHYVEVRVDGMENMPNTRNLFRYNDLLNLLKRLGIVSVPDHYIKLYQTKIVQNYLEFWRKQ